MSAQWMTKADGVFTLSGQNWQAQWTVVADGVSNTFVLFGNSASSLTITDNGSPTTSWSLQSDLHTVVFTGVPTGGHTLVFTYIIGGAINPRDLPLSFTPLEILDKTGAADGLAPVFNGNTGKPAWAVPLRVQVDPFTVSGLGPYNLTKTANGGLFLLFTDAGFETNFSNTSTQWSFTAGYTTSEVQKAWAVYSY